MATGRDGNTSAPASAPPSSSQSAGDLPPSVVAPQISLPKGGGAIRGIGEKFAANPVTGTGSMTIPLPASPARSGFGPRLELAYDSGAGNGPFGFGWRLSLPSITRKTDKGLPCYDGTDLFVLSGAEDLVPVVEPAALDWKQPKPQRRTIGAVTYLVRRYRPRIESAFARIEQWTDVATGISHWRSITPDDVTTLYGRTDESRISDPDDPARVFTWLICESFDDKGNAVAYTYKRENSAGVDRAAACERNRTPAGRAANRHLKSIRYGNRLSTLTDPSAADRDWMFEVVLDYGEHAAADPRPSDVGAWPCRRDPFSSYRAGFEVRTYRLCRRVLLFHHFDGEAGVGRDCLVRSTDLAYREAAPGSGDEDDPATGTFLISATQHGHRRDPAGGYVTRPMPAVEFEYSEPRIGGEVEEVGEADRENVPYGVDGANYQWTDLDGEGISGILSEQAGAWFFKPNRGDGRFAATAPVATRPATASLGGGHQLLDLAGDGQLDVVAFGGPAPGFFERTPSRDWEPFRPFARLPKIAWDDPNLRFVDLDGDGHADVLITEGDAFTWYRSLAEDGFDAARRVAQPSDEERGPRLVFADGSQSIYLADMSGDGLTDLVRIRNGEACYWPNVGHGRFGARVSMDDAPWFDPADQFDQRRVRLADVDGSGTTDVIYLGTDGVRIYFNHSGNRFGRPRRIEVFPPVDNASSVTTTDLKGNGTACLVWSSPLPCDARRLMRFVDLMGGQKPHLLVGVKNNLGAETRVRYASSTKFYLADLAAGTPWRTRLPFPVHVVERVEVLDRISRNRFVTRYAYHHGSFDGVEREFRGFGMVEQWDTEEFAALAASGEVDDAAVNIDASSHVPPAHTKTWFHTGARVEDGTLSAQFQDEYYHEGDDSLHEAGLTAGQAAAMLLDDTTLPDGVLLAGPTRAEWALSDDEGREACRVLKGSILRQEVYADDGTERQDRPYTVSERNYTVELLQPQADGGPHAVFLVHPRESIEFHYERQLDPVTRAADPRVTHSVVLEVDEFGNVCRSASIAYGRRGDLADGVLTDEDRAAQKRIHVTCVENDYTNAVINEDDAYRAPVLWQARTYEVLQLRPKAALAGVTNLFTFAELRDGLAEAGRHELPYEDIFAATATEPHAYRRPIERVRTRYRRRDLTGPLAFGEIDALALPLESYKLAFTPGLLSELLIRPAKLPATDVDGVMRGEGGYVDLDGDGSWWAPSGQTRYAADDVPAAQELAAATAGFFLPERFIDPFGGVATIRYDRHRLLVTQSRDAVGNTVTAGELAADGSIAKPGNDYRALQPTLVTDANGNRSAVAVDALGMVCGTALMGKVTENLGDTLDAVDPDAPDAAAHLADPLADPGAILRGATTLLLYDLFAYQRTRDATQPDAPVAYTAVRESHHADVVSGAATLKVQHTFAYSDGFGREIQKKVQAEPAAAAPGAPPKPRWVGTGWTVYNNKGQPVRKYEPFFSDSPRFEFAKVVGVSSILCYDPVGRVVATIHPNQTYEKVVFDPWRQATWDVNDTVKTPDPKLDPDVGEFFRRLPAAEYPASWHAQRAGGALGAHEQAAAQKTELHADTPTVAHFDSPGRTFLSVAHNRTGAPGGNGGAADEKYATRTLLDVEGNPRQVRDALGRLVVTYDYDMLGTRVRRSSMEAGERWTLNDVTGKPIVTWDGRGHRVRTAYDLLRRPTEARLSVAGAAEAVVTRTVYGEGAADAEARNLRGKVAESFDAAGVVTHVAYDFKGNLLRSRRRLRVEYKREADWAAGEALEDEVFTGSTWYDALNRVVQQIAPHTDRPGAKVNVTRPGYNEANLLETLDAWLGLGAEPDALLDAATASLHAVADVGYNARGQRTRIVYGNGATTTYEYDPKTFRLTHLYTARDAAAFAGDDPSAPNLPRGVQNLRYVYDPVGNITHVQDDAQPTIFFDNQRVDPHNDYAYDATYRLVEATGREHLGQAAAGLGPPVPHSPTDAPRVNAPNPRDGQAFGRYRERYEYDGVGNFLHMRHAGTDPANPGWDRGYAYDEPSQLEPAARKSNRLSSTDIDPDLFTYDAHGNTTSMPHLKLMRWDHRDQLRATAQQIVNGGVPETTWYVYDAGGQRVRKVTESAVTAADAAGGRAPTVLRERVYLGGFEIYREFSPADASVTLERETLHVIDDHQRVAMVEQRTRGDDGTQALVVRYQLASHLGSTVGELDAAGAMISFEEFTPFGSTSYQANRAAAAPKRYRFTVMERDEETGLAYHTARYYAPWLGRWASADPAGLVDGPDLYRYAKDNPVLLLDPNGTEPIVNSGDPNDPQNYVSFESFANGAQGPMSDQALGQAWSAAQGGTGAASPASTGTPPAPAAAADTPTGGGVPGPPPAPKPWYRPWVNRGLGALQVVGGGFEIAGGLGGGAVTCLETLGGGCVVGGMLALHGLDTLSSGIGTLWRGEVSETYTKRGISATAEFAGADKKTADRIGTGGDLLVGLGGGLLARAPGAAARVGEEALAEGASGTLTLGYKPFTAGPVSHNMVEIAQGGNAVTYDLRATGALRPLLQGTESNFAARGSSLGADYFTASFSASGAEIRAAQSMAAQLAARGNVPWSVLGPNCATDAAAVLRAGGASIPTWSITPSTLYLGAKLGQAPYVGAVGGAALAPELSRSSSR